MVLELIVTLSERHADSVHCEEKSPNPVIVPVNLKICSFVPLYQSNQAGGSSNENAGNQKS